MTNKLGRLLLISRPDLANPGQFLNACGFRSRNFSISNSSIDEVDHNCQTPEDSPQRSRVTGMQDRTFSGQGRYADEVNGAAIALAAENNDTLEGWKVTVPGHGSYVGDWLISNFTFTGEIEGSMTFSCEIGQKTNPTFTAEV